MSFTAGISGDDFDLDIDNIDESQVNPKFGLNWDMSSTLRFRLAAFRTLKRSLISNQTIEPTQVAGFNQFFDDFTATDAKRYGVGLDYNSRHKLYGGIELTKRDLTIPKFSNNRVIHENEDEYLHRAYVYATLTKTTALSLDYNYEKFRRKESRLNEPEKLTTHRLPLTLNYHNPNGVFASITPSYLKQDIKHQVSTVLVNENDDAWLIDAQAGYRLPKRLGVISLNGYNLFDANFKYEDVDWFNSPSKQPTVQSERLVILKIALSFY
jgi:predicted porin